MPVRLDGERLALVALIERVGEIVGSYGWGRIDMVENRRVGIKSRETYECPASLALILAHADLESITLERDLGREKARLEPRYAELIYDGLWFSPLKQAPTTRSSTTASGTSPATCGFASSRARAAVTGRRSPDALYDYGLATYDAADTFRHEDSEGFVRLWGLSVQTWAARQGPGREAGSHYDSPGREAGS